MSIFEDMLSDLQERHISLDMQIQSVYTALALVESELAAYRESLSYTTPSGLEEKLEEATLITERQRDYLIGKLTILYKRKEEQRLMKERGY